MRRRLPLLALASLLAAPLTAQDPASACSPGVYFLRHGQYRQALQYLAPTDSSDSAAAVANLRGVAEMMVGAAASALRSFETALATDPTFYQARFNRGMALAALGRPDEAAAEFASVYAAYAPLKASAAYEHAWIDLKQTHLSAALVWVLRSINEDSTLTDALLLLGLIEERRGNFQEAGTAYRRYLQNHPQSTTAMLRFGIAAQRTGHPETAKRYFRQIIEIAPGSSDAVEARKFLIMWD